MCNMNGDFGCGTGAYDVSYFLHLVNGGHVNSTMIRQYFTDSILHCICVVSLW